MRLHKAKCPDLEHGGHGVKVLLVVLVERITLFCRS